MRYTIIFWVFGLFLFFIACAKNENQRDPNSPALSAAAGQTLRAQEYAKWKARRTDTLPIQQIQEAGKLYPVDEAPLDTSFFIFREKLLQAVRTKNIIPILDALAPDCKVTFGPEVGVDGFIEVWGLESEEKTLSSPLWKELERVLANGGVFSNQGQRFIAPYTFSTWPDTADAFSRLLVTGAGVRLRENPALQATILENLSHEMVTFLDETGDELTLQGETHRWAKVRSAKGNEGFIWGKYLASQLDFRAGFEQKTDGSWHITFFLAGD